MPHDRAQLLAGAESLISRAAVDETSAAAATDAGLALIPEGPPAGRSEKEAFLVLRRDALFAADVLAARVSTGTRLAGGWRVGDQQFWPEGERAGFYKSCGMAKRKAIFFGDKSLIPPDGAADPQILAKFSDELPGILEGAVRSQFKQAQRQYESLRLPAVQALARLDIAPAFDGRSDDLSTRSSQFNATLSSTLRVIKDAVENDRYNRELLAEAVDREAANRAPAAHYVDAIEAVEMAIHALYHNAEFSLILGPAAKTTLRQVNGPFAGARRAYVSLRAPLLDEGALPPTWRDHGEHPELAELQQSRAAADAAALAIATQLENWLSDRAILDPQSLAQTSEEWYRTIELTLPDAAPQMLDALGAMSTMLAENPRLTMQASRALQKYLLDHGDSTLSITNGRWRFRVDRLKGKSPAVLVKDRFKPYRRERRLDELAAIEQHRDLVAGYGKTVAAVLSQPDSYDAPHPLVEADNNLRRNLAGVLPNRDGQSL